MVIDLKEENIDFDDGHNSAPKSLDIPAPNYLEEINNI